MARAWLIPESLANPKDSQSRQRRPRRTETKTGVNAVDAAVGACRVTSPELAERTETG